MNGHAYRDDAQIVRATIVRRWAADDEREHMLLTVQQLPVPADVAAAVALLDERRTARTSPSLPEDAAPAVSDDLDRSAA